MMKEISNDEREEYMALSDVSDSSQEITLLANKHYPSVVSPNYGQKVRVCRVAFHKDADTPKGSVIWYDSRENGIRVNGRAKESKWYGNEDNILKQDILDWGGKLYLEVKKQIKQELNKTQTPKK